MFTSAHVVDNKMYVVLARSIAKLRVSFFSFCKICYCNGPPSRTPLHIVTILTVVHQAHRKRFGYCFETF